MLDLTNGICVSKPAILNRGHEAVLGAALRENYLLRNRIGMTRCIEVTDEGIPVPSIAITGQVSHYFQVVTRIICR